MIWDSVFRRPASHLRTVLTAGMLAVGWAFSTSQMIAAVPVAVLPSSFTLDGRDAIQQLAVVRHVVSEENLYGPTLNPSLYRLVSSDSSVVKIENGQAISVGNGQAKIQLQVDGETIATADVQVEHCDQPRQWSFRNEVQSILARQGCNMGACHGALAGKGGFRLSLRGYDAESDYAAIALEARGRRIEVADPGRSLLLAKPTGVLPHKGGVRLNVDDRDYRVIAEWIAAGAAKPSDEDPRLLRIEVSPQSSYLQPGDQTRILVAAHYDDGRVVDVTQWSKFSATDEAVAAVDDDGMVTVQGSGVGAVLVWFGSKVQLARLTVPYQHDFEDEVFASSPRRNFIDELNLQQLQTLRLQPNPRCGDEAFLRRVYLDTVGRLPTPAERSDFLLACSGQSEAQKRIVRDDVIEQLLASEAFVDYWTYRISDILLINGNRLRPLAVKAYYQWLRSEIAAGTAWDDLVREILTAQGVSTDNGATNFYALHQTPEEMTENACQAFLGLSIGCAKCHNHPLEKWTNDQYYAMANLFARVRAKGWGGDSRNGDGVRTVYAADSGELIQPSTGLPQPPAPLDAEPLAFDDPHDRRITLADWLTDPANPYFARAITNRVWANFFGRGLVEEVDDLRLSNPASHEGLLRATAEHLVELDFDLRGLMRAMLQSETYQRSSLPGPGNADDEKYLSRYFPRRLIAEVILDGIDQTLDTSTKFDRVQYSGADSQATDFYPAGTRAIQLYDSAVSSYFLKTFGRNPREITCDCERSNEPSMVQVLHLSNGQTLNDKLDAPDSVIAQWIKSGRSDAEIIEELFIRSLCREPTEVELRNLLDVMADYPAEQRHQALSDAGWSVLTSTEFTFNH